MAAEIGKAKISYTYYCTPKAAGQDKALDWQSIKQAIDGKFTECWFDDDPKDVASLPELSQLETVKNFLYGAGMPFPCRRAFIDDFSLSHPSIDVADDCVLISYFEDVNIMSFTLNVMVRNVSRMDMIYLRQVFCDNPVFIFNDDHARTKPDGTAFAAGSGGIGSWAAVTANTRPGEDGLLRVSVENVFRSVLSMLGIDPQSTDQAYLCEVNDMADIPDAEAAEQKFKGFIYGLMSGDEGWMYVPSEVIDARLSVSWGSRKFVRFYNFGMGSVVINLDGGSVYENYIGHQEEFGGRYYGGINPYFLLDSPIAGVAHGIMLSLETVLVIKTIADRIYAHQSEYQKQSGGSLRQTLKKTKEYRRELIMTLRRLENITISEMGELENLLVRSQHIESLLDKLRYLLELLESEIDLLYQESTNRLVNILTIAGLVLSALGAAASWVGLL